MILYISLLDADGREASDRISCEFSIRREGRDFILGNCADVSGVATADVQPEHVALWIARDVTDPLWTQARLRYSYDLKAGDCFTLPRHALRLELVPLGSAAP